MCTDSVALSPEFCQEVRRWLEAHDPDNIPPRATQHRRRKAAQEAHEAIRPTDIHRPSAQLRTELSADEFALYVLIWKRSVASRCKPARLHKTRVITQSGPLYWEARGQVIEFLGYARYWHNLQAEAELPTLTPQQALTLQQSQADQKQTQPPPRYSEPKLVQLMERKGIGRPSTYAPTIKILKERSYVQAVKGKLQPTELGLALDAALEKLLTKIIDPAFTAEMEQALDRIAQGELNWEQWLIRWNQDWFTPALEQAKKLILENPSVAVPVKSVERLKESISEPSIESTIEQRKGRSKKSAKGKLNEQVNPACSQCQQPMIKVNSRKVAKGFFLKCPQCNDSVLFWNDRQQQWQPPRPQVASSVEPPSGNLTGYPCPVCRQPLEEYAYHKDGQSKVMLRCSDRQARLENHHQDAVYFYTTKGNFWSPKFGNLPGPDASPGEQ
jgi:DNA topoisomerase-1